MGVQPCSPLSLALPLLSAAKVVLVEARTRGIINVIPIDRHVGISLLFLGLL